MNRLLIVLAVLLLSAPLLSVVLGEPAQDDAPVGPPPELFVPEAQDPVTIPAPAYSHPAEDARYRDAAATAWAYVENQYQPTTGLVNSVINYPYATVWDMGSTLAAYYSAYELGLIDQADYDRRMSRALQTLQSLRLFDNAFFNKNYQVQRGAVAGSNDRERSPYRDGYGFSATDLGRLLIWLRLVASAHPQHAEAATQVVERLDLDRVVKDGYLWGALRGRRGKIWTFQEGRIGYEQYAAAGFALWGKAPTRALQMELNAVPTEVMGIPLYDDRRGESFLTSEPFFLIGMELGWWRPMWQEMALQVLAAQKARFDQTGQLTAVSEDAVPVAPHYFYYYTVSYGGEDFAVASITSPTPLPTGPRWLSTKAAFAWYAVFPGPYTWQLVEAMEPAADPKLGWNSGIFERNGKPTGGQNINTAAVILESALYLAQRQPLIATAGASLPTAAAPVGGQQ